MQDTNLFVMMNNHETAVLVVSKEAQVRPWKCLSFHSLCPSAEGDGALDRASVVQNSGVSVSTGLHLTHRSGLEQLQA